MPEQDRHLAGAIEARRKELGLSVQDLVDMTGLTRQGLQPLLRGERKRYQDRLKLPLCHVLEWTPDSIDRLLAGLNPVRLTESSPELATRLSDVEVKLLTIQETRQDAVEAMFGRFQSMQDQIDGLARQIAEGQSTRDDLAETLEAELASITERLDRLERPGERRVNG